MRHKPSNILLTQNIGGQGSIYPLLLHTKREKEGGQITNIIHPHLLGFMFYVYVLKSSKDKQLYIGYTKDLKQRLEKHNSKKIFSTAKRTPLDLVYYEAFKSQQDATAREQKLKEFKSAYGQLKKRIALSLA